MATKKPTTKAGLQLVKAHMESTASTYSSKRWASKVLNERIARLEKRLVDQKGIDGAESDMRMQIVNLKIHDLAVESYYDPKHKLNKELRKKYGKDYTPGTLGEHKEAVINMNAAFKIATAHQRNPKAYKKIIGEEYSRFQSKRGDLSIQPQHKKLVESEHKYEMENVKARNKAKKLTQKNLDKSAKR